MWMSEASCSIAARTMSAKSIDMRRGSAARWAVLRAAGRSASEHPDDLVDRGEALAHLAEGVVAQRAHALAARGGGDRVARGRVERELADCGGDGHDLVDADAAPVAAASTARAAAGLERVDVLVAVEARVPERLRPEGHRPPAARAQHAREPLGDDAADRGGDEEGLDSHLDEACDRARRVVRVQRREQEMARERG